MKKYKWNNFDKAFLLSWILFLILDLVWMGLEVFFYGQVQHRIVDDIIGVPIIVSLYLNALLYFENKSNKRK